jgi:hypothetical protein
VTPVLLLLTIAACTVHHGAEASLGRPPQVRFRVGQPPDAESGEVLAALPGSRWDPGLLAATRELASVATSTRSRLTPAAAALALGRAGYPGDARVARLVNGGAFPSELVAEARSVAADDPSLDVGLANRRFGDGTTLWILAVAPHRCEIDPIPRDIALDEPIDVRVDAPGAGHLVLFVGAPDGAVSSEEMSAGVAHWIDAFHLPGEYRVEVVDQAPGRARVDLEFSIFVDGPPPAPSSLPDTLPPPDPMAAAEWLYRALDEHRVRLGLRPLSRFSAFEPLAREHSAYMAQTGIVDHALQGLTEGVAAQAWRFFHPAARHTEDVAAAFSASEAMDAVWLSPGHRKNLLCADCTHASIGVAIEPVTDAVPRLFVTWEMLSFPQGEPRPIGQR